MMKKNIVIYHLELMLYHRHHHLQIIIDHQNIHLEEDMVLITLLLVHYLGKRRKIIIKIFLIILNVLLVLLINLLMVVLVAVVLILMKNIGFSILYHFADKMHNLF